MPRKIRIEYPGACYHVMNRGNYRSWIFKTAGARKSFLKALQECCYAEGWILHAWCLMGNHYHLCIETPDGNLVKGMRWLQSVFANRFNRFRNANGHVFQGRYKAILLEGSAVGPVCHYIHLNPVRAGILCCEELEKYEHSSFHQMWHLRKRWRFCNFSTGLDAAGHLEDDENGWASYREYLNWLSEEDEAQKKLGFEKMLQGWAKGSKEFKEKILAEIPKDKLDKVVESDANEIKAHKWEIALPEVLIQLGKESSDILKGKKSEPWKVAAACFFREKYLAPYKWIAEQLDMGAISSVQSMVCRYRKQKGKPDEWMKKLRNLKQGTVD